MIHDLSCPCVDLFWQGWGALIYCNSGSSSRIISAVEQLQTFLSRGGAGSTTTTDNKRIHLYPVEISLWKIFIQPHNVDGSTQLDLDLWHCNTFFLQTVHMTVDFLFVTFIFPGTLFVLSMLVIYIVRHSHTWEQNKNTQSLRCFIGAIWSSVPCSRARQGQLIKERVCAVSSHFSCSHFHCFVAWSPWHLLYFQWDKAKRISAGHRILNTGYKSHFEEFASGV